MNEQVQGYLAEILRRGISGLDAAGSFLSAELPLFIKEFLLFHMVWNWAIVMFTLAVIIVWLAFIPVARRNQVEGWMVWAIAGCMPIICAVSFFFAHLQQAVLVTFAPRYFLMLELAKLLK